MPRIAVPPHLSPAAFAGHDGSLPVVDLEGGTMGTVWRVRFAAPRGTDVAALRLAVETRLDGLVDEMSHWQADSALKRYEGSVAGSWVALPPDFAHVIEAGLRIAELTGGAFDPSMGRLTAIWGIGPDPVEAPPEAVEIAGALARSGFERMAYDRAARLLYQPGGLALDLSGIAKGHAADAVSDLLRTRGIQHCLVEVGGELVGRGMRPDLDPWWVELETPAETGLAPIRVALHELAVASSGDYVRGPHTLDPRNGLPLDNGVVAVSACHASAMMADAWATALTVLGADEGLDLASREEIAARWITRDGDSYRETLSPRLEAML